MFRIVPKILYYDTVADFHQAFKLAPGDLLVTNRWLFDSYIKPLGINIPVIFQEEYGTGEPTDEMIDAMSSDMAAFEYDRIIAFGGGSIVDICKVLCLEMPNRSFKLFTGEITPKKVRKLVAIPTTCGTGSEVTNVAIAELKSLHTKKGLASDATYADTAVLIPQPLQSLPDHVFTTSSIDALIHAMESYLSPQASPFTELFSLEAVRLILCGYQTILSRGGNKAEHRSDLMKEFCLAANYAGIAFGNAGCAAIHALSYSIGGAFHVPHGEANYQFFAEVFKIYMEKNPKGKIAQINKLLAVILECELADAYQSLEKVLNQLLVKKPLHQYGMKRSQIEEFTTSTIKNQQRLLSNNYVPLSREDIAGIFSRLY